MNTNGPDLRVTDPQVRTRLAHAAEYLARLPDEQFTMRRYSTGGGVAESLAQEHRHCGCIIGHVPHIAPKLTRTLVARSCDNAYDELLTWFELGRAFIRYEQLERPAGDILFKWLFDAEWSHVDDTLEGAVERIRIALEDGVPQTFAETPGNSPERYALDHPGAPGGTPRPLP